MVRCLRSFCGSRPLRHSRSCSRQRVSRATAYRYFPTQESLLIEVTDVTPMVASVEDLLKELAAADGLSAEERLGRLLDTFNPIVVAEEVPLRTALRVYLDT